VDAAIADRTRSTLRASLATHVPGVAVWVYGSLVKPGRHLFRHAYDLDLDPVRVTAAADNAARCVRSFDGWCAAFLATVRSQFRDES
jgi:hypothetical protein